jgi:oxaloacetate decarboxylase beta subunit
MGFLGMDHLNVCMILIALFLAFLAIYKKYEPMLLLPLSLGILISNIPAAGLGAYYIKEAKKDEAIVKMIDQDVMTSAKFLLDNGIELREGIDGIEILLKERKVKENKRNEILNHARFLMNQGVDIHREIAKVERSDTTIFDSIQMPGEEPVVFREILQQPGLMSFIYQGIWLVIFPPLIFLCIGAMTDFGPLIANPKLWIIGIGGQLGIFIAMLVSYYLSHWLAPYIPNLDPFTLKEAAAIGIIGSSDGPTSIYTATRLAPNLLPSIAIAAFSYMALVPFIQPPIMRMLTTAKERVIVMPEPKQVSQKQKIMFPFVMILITLLIFPSASALIGMLMIGNILKESGVTNRFVPTLQTEFLNLLTLFVGMSIGCSATAERFLTPQTLIILLSGLLAFAFGTVGGMATAKLLCFLTRGKINPLIGNSGVSAMPMAARISQRMGQKYNPESHLLMHAMGPIVASTVGSAMVAGVFISFFLSK